MATTTLHITNGDSATERLHSARIAGHISTYAEPLHVGPVLPHNTPGAAELRSRWLAEAGIVPFAVAQEFGRRWQDALDRHAEYDVVVLWFEHDLFDQLLLIRHLSWFAQAGRATGIELVQADDYLGPMQLADIGRQYEQRMPVSEAHIATAQRVWNGFTSNDHTQLHRFADTDLLPWLASAMARMLEEYPNEKQGLGRTDRQILESLAEREMSFADLFRATNEREAAVFMGDTIFEWYLRELAQARRPLITLAKSIALTDIGRSVLSGSQNAIELNGIDRWIGGVRLRVPQH